MAEDRPQRRVVLVGMMGSGKSTVGEALSARMGWPYMDNDTLVRAVTGREPEEIDEHDGEAALHAAEAQALRHAMTVPPPLIASAAAFVVTDPDSLALVRGALVVYLRARPATLRLRIGTGSGRRDEATDLDWLAERHAERDDAYRRIATLSIDTDDLPVEAIVDRIVNVLIETNDAAPTRD